MTTSQNPTSPETGRQDGAATQPADSTSGSEHVMDMLGEHVPLSLLMDLTSPTGPDSVTIHDDEGLPADSWWEVGGDGASSDAGQTGAEDR